MPRHGRALLSGLALSTLFCLPLLPEILGARRLVFRDAQITHWPWRRVAVSSLAAGRVPFVNEGASGGEPLLANPNAALLYPTFLLESVLPPACAFNWHYLLHVLWAFFGARALARRLSLSEGAAFLAGAAYAFSGMMLSYASAFLNSSAAAAWLPWCAAATLDLARARGGRRTLRPLAATAIAFGLQLLAGEPAISLLTLLFCAALGLLALPRERRGRAAARFLVGAAAAGAAATALAAPLLLPLLQVMPLTYRGQHLYSARAFSASPFAPWRAIEWLFPRFGGDPGALGVGAHWQYALHRGDLVYIWCVTFGVIPLLAVALAGLSGRFWRGPRLGLAAGAAAAFLFSLGSTLPFYRALASVAPLRRLRYPIKFYLLTTLCVALLAGFAVDHFRARRAGRRVAAGIAAVILFYLAALAAAGAGGPLDRLVRPLLSGLALPPEALLPAIRGVFGGDALAGLAAAALLALVLFVRPRAPSVGYLLGFATALLALPWGLALFVSADEKDLERPPALSSALAGPGRLFVSPRLPEFNVLATGSAHPDLPPRVAKLARAQIEELIPATAEAFGVRYLFDADPDGSYGWYNRLANEALSVSSPIERSRLLRLYGARWVLAEEREAYPLTRSVTGLTVAGRRLALSELDRPAAELRWAGRAFRRASLSGALALVRSDRFEPSTDVVLPGASDRDGDTARAAPASLAPEFVSADAAAARVDAAARGHLVFSRTYFPAWKARLDGRPVPVLVANARDLAVAVPAGSHRVEFFYDRAPLRRGAILQATAFALILLAALARPR